MTVNTAILLDKLYNLRGSDSDILKEMDRQKIKQNKREIEQRRRRQNFKKILQVWKSKEKN